MIEYTKERPLRVFEAFAGYGSQMLALYRLMKAYPDFSAKCVGWAEFDPQSKQALDKQPAVIAHKALHPDAGKNYGDIAKVNWDEVPDFDLFTFSFPCTDVSQAGLGKGLEKGSGTRSSMLWECENAIRVKRPRYLMLENVKNLISKKFIGYYTKWLEILEGYGYANFTSVLNAKDFGVAQNRERVFCISILRTEKDPDPQYNFPEPFSLEKRLKDYLEPEVDEKYYVSDKLLEPFFEDEKEADTD